MRRFSEGYGLVLVLATIALTFVFRAIYEDAFRAWIQGRLARAGYSEMATGFMSAIAELIPSLTLAGAIIYAVHWYVRRQYTQGSAGIDTTREPAIADAPIPSLSAIKVVEARVSLLPPSLARTFEILIKNDSGRELSNCLVKVTDIKAVRASGPNGESTEDMSRIYKPVLPLALRTARNEERDGGGPFHMRNGETKKIRICSHDGSTRANLQMHFEPGLAAYVYNLPNIKTCELEISILSDAPPTVERFFLSLDDDGYLIVARNDSLDTHTPAREALWLLRKEGVLLRNDGKVTRLVSRWTAEYEDWHSRLIAHAAIVSSDLRHSLDPLDKIEARNSEAVAVPDPHHQKRVSAMSEKLDRLYKHLSKET